jgi:uncharacterized protein
VTRRGGPLLVGVAELLGRPGERRTLRTTVTLDDLAITSARVPSGGALEVDVVLESVLGGRLTVTGAVDAPWQGECRRCLGDVVGTLRAAVDEVFTEPGAQDAEDPDLLALEGTDADLEPVVREAVLLALPLSPLCRSDCEGPAPDRFPARPAPDDPPPVAPGGDPRWSALDQLRFDE